MTTNLTQGVVQVFGNSPAEINTALRQIVNLIDRLAGLRGGASIFDTLNVSDNLAVSQNLTVGGTASFTPASPTAVTDLTNHVTAGGTTDTIDNFTSLTTYSTDAATIRNDIYQLTVKVDAIIAGLKSLGFFN